jgi:hypothetical protein
LIPGQIKQLGKKETHSGLLLGKASKTLRTFIKLEIPAKLPAKKSDSLSFKTVKGDLL